MCSVCVCLDAVDSCVNIIGGMTVFASLEDAVVGVHYGEMNATYTFCPYVMVTYLGYVQVCVCVSVYCFFTCTCFMREHLHVCL